MIKYIELFSGAGGLGYGFAENKNYDHKLSVEWEKWPLLSAKKHFANKFNHNSEDFIRYDISRVDNLLNGFDDEYGTFEGIANKTKTVDVIIGGPPCQAYSVANRRHYKDNQDDPKNVLFESYLSIAKKMKAKYFVFENVPGMLSAKIGDKKIVDLVKKDAAKKGFVVPDDFKKFIFDMSEFGVPQKRKRIILVGVRKDIHDQNKNIFDEFLMRMNKQKNKKIVTVSQAIDGLGTFERHDGKYIRNDDGIYPQLHNPRFHNPRDIKIFNEAIILKNKGLLNQIESIKLYEKYHHIKSNVHKFHVLDNDKPSTTILAHLYKDGNRFILQSNENRTITPREAARLQTFPDDYEFLGGQGHAYKMIGNAVPPKFSKIIAKVLKEII